MRKIVKALSILICIFLFSIVSSASNPVDANMYAEEVAKIFTGNRPKAAYKILNKWEEEFGVSEPLIRAKIIIDLMCGTVIEGKYYLTTPTHSSLSSYAIEYRKRNRIEKERAEQSITTDTTINGVVVGGVFDITVSSKAKQLLENYPKESLGWALCKLYANGDVEFYTIWSGMNDLSKKMKLKIDCQRDRRVSYSNMNLSLGLASEFNMGSLSQIGNGYGIVLKGLLEIAPVEVRFTEEIMGYEHLPNLNPPEITKDIKEPKMTSTNLGLEFASEITNIYGIGVFWNSGAALKIIGIGGKGSEEYYINTYNYSLGCELRYFCKDNLGNNYKYNFYSLSFKYNLTDYTQEDIINLTGNYITIQLQYSWTLSGNQR